MTGGDERGPGEKAAKVMCVEGCEIKYVSSTWGTRTGGKDGVCTGL